MMLIISLLIRFFLSVQSKECNQSEIIVQRLGEGLELNFVLSDIRDEYKQVISDHGGKSKLKDIEVLKMVSMILFRNETDPDRAQVIFMSGIPSDHLDRNRTTIFQTSERIVVNKTRLQKEDAGLYWIEFRSIFLGRKGLILTGKPQIRPKFPSHPVLKVEDNYTATIPLECQVVSTSVGICRPFYNSMYIIWYENGLRMTNTDPQRRIYVTIDHNGGNFTCVATDYLPCYERLQTTIHYDKNSSFKECVDVAQSAKLNVRPTWADKREEVVSSDDYYKRIIFLLLGIMSLLFFGYVILILVMIRNQKNRKGRLMSGRYNRGKTDSKEDFFTFNLH